MSWRFNSSNFRIDDRQPEEAMWNPASGEFVSPPTSLHLTAHLQQNSQHYSSSAVLVVVNHWNLPTQIWCEII